MPELENGGEGIIKAGIKGGRAQFYFFQETHVQDTGRSARTALGGKVIDHRDFDAIEVVHIFIRCATPYDDVVAETTHTSCCSAYARERLDYPGDIEVATWITPDFFRGQPLYT